MPPVGGCVGRRCGWFRGCCDDRLRAGVVGSGHGAGKHVDHTAADVDVKREEGVAGEIAEGLECSIQSIGCFLVEGEVDWLLDGLLLGFHGRPNECPASWCWAAFCLDLVRAEACCDPAQLRKVACKPLLFGMSALYTPETSCMCLF